MTRNALVVGGSGLLGGNLIRRLGDTPHWRIKSLSRRPIDTAVPVHHVAADLLDRTRLHACADLFSDVTHVFFCSRAVTQGYVISVDANTVMLENLLDVMLPVAPALQHVQLVHGLKWYGSHVGPIKLPAKESDPPHADSSFYRNQQDLLTRRQAGRGWSWSTVRPNFICAVATDSPSNLVAALGTFAAILRELGQELWFPGSQQAFDAVTSVVDIDLLTKCMLWARNRSELRQQRFQRGERRLLPLAGCLASDCPGIRYGARRGAANGSGAVHGGQERRMGRYRRQARAAVDAVRDDGRLEFREEQRVRIDLGCFRLDGEGPPVWISRHGR
jgi:nucleoside-diphosphate-sugar epimerase